MLIIPPHRDPHDLLKQARASNCGNREWQLAKEEFADALVELCLRE
jgi:hypothetical protein